MKRFFDEEVKTESRYNRIPRGMRRKQIPICAGCEYRIYYMQVDIAGEEASRRGGSKRDYLSGFYMQPNPECKRREKCLAGGFLILRGAKAPSSPLIKKTKGFLDDPKSRGFMDIKRLLKLKNLTKLSKEERGRK